MMRRFRRSRRLVLGGAALLTALVGASLLPCQAWAAHTTCRSDPRVFLSNGTIFNLGVTISDGASDVQRVSYTLHGPAGTTVTKIVYTGYSFAGKESFQYYADDPANAYDSHIVVTTGTPRITVTGTTTMTNQTSSVRATSSTTGTSGQDLGVHLV